MGYKIVSGQKGSPREGSMFIPMHGHAPVRCHLKTMGFTTGRRIDSVSVTIEGRSDTNWALVAAYVLLIHMRDSQEAGKLGALNNSGLWHD